ncbi:MAG TPA: GNAT family N-acetyltransferase [Acidobacteriaceae bacterium]|jgi:predicted GNAT superfamily acetyltransferase
MIKEQSKHLEMAAPEMQLEVRSCQGFDELEACVALQIATWGYEEMDVVPRRTFTVAQRIGGQVLGAFTEDGTLAGFAMSIPGIRSGVPYLHSYMLAVRPEFRNAGLGRRLKLAQRDDALKRGIRLMEWTFDPLEIKNSFFNIEKLGAITRSYSPNFYGVSSARIQGGRPTDRLHAEWWLDSERVIEAIAGRRPPPGKVEMRIELPHQVMQWKESAEGAAQAMALQEKNRKQFAEAFAHGLAVSGFSRDQEGNGWFELSRWQGLPGSAESRPAVS